MRRDGGPAEEIASLTDRRAIGREAKSGCRVRSLDGSAAAAPFLEPTPAAAPAHLGAGGGALREVEPAVLVRVVTGKEAPLPAASPAREVRPPGPVRPGIGSRRGTVAKSGRRARRPERVRPAPSSRGRRAPHRRQERRSRRRPRSRAISGSRRRSHRARPGGPHPYPWRRGASARGYALARTSRGRGREAARRRRAGGKPRARSRR